MNSDGTKIDIDAISKVWQEQTERYDDEQDISDSLINYRAMLATDRSNPEAGVLYTNSHGMHFYRWMFESMKNISFNEGIVTTNRAGVEVYRDFLTLNVDQFRKAGATEDVMSGLHQVISVFDKTLKDNLVSLSLINTDHSKELRELTVAHEVLHGWQFLIEEKTGRPHVADTWVIQQPGIDKVYRWLALKNYQLTASSVGKEWAAYGATNAIEQMGFTPKQTSSFLRSYFTQVAAEHGIEVFDKIGRVSPEARAIINETKVQFAAQRQEGIQNEDAQGKTEGKPDHSPKFQRIDLGRDSDRRFSAGRSLEARLAGQGIVGEGEPALLTGGISGRERERRAIEENGHPLSPRSDLSAYSRNEEQRGLAFPAGFTQSLQRGDENPDSLIRAVESRIDPAAALHKIADLEKNDPAGTRPWKDLAHDAGEIAREAIAKIDPTQTGKDNEQISALEKIAALAPVDSSGKMYSWKELASGAIETARQTLTDASASIEMIDQSIEPQKVSPTQGLGW